MNTTQQGNEAELKHCPYCGSACKIIHKHYKKNYMGMRTSGSGFMNMPAMTIWFVTCSNSYCSMKPTTPYQHEKQEAIKIWNTRYETTNKQP